MLKDLYGENIAQRKQCNTEINLNANTVHKNDIGFTNSDKEKVNHEHGIIAPTSANYNNNTYKCSPAVQENNSLNDSMNLMPSHAVSYDSKVGYVRVTYCQDQSLPNEMQSHTLLMSQRKALDVDHISASKPPNQVLPHKCVPSSQDPFLYVPLNAEINFDT